MSHRRTSPAIFAKSYALRRSQTEAEAILWSRLRGHRLHDIHFRRQHAIGNYIVDFCAPSKKLIIELDGDQHLDQQEYDGERTASFESEGYRLLRFWNDEVTHDIENVLCAIALALQDD